jgi:hypothetical protein
MPYRPVRELRLAITVVAALSTIIMDTLPCVVAASPRGRGLVVTIPAAGGEGVDLYKGSYALVLGNSAYKNGLDPLPGVAQDVVDVSRALEQNGFAVTARTDLSKAEFQRAVAEFVLRHGRDPDNRLLFYYAGHGYTEPTATGEELGYLIMVDAPDPVKDEIGFKLASLDMQYFVTQSKLIQAKHVLFLFDSCFSGTILNFRATVKPKAVSDAVRYPVRQFITAGRAKEPVPDRSVFKQAFVDILEGRAPEPIADGYLTGEELGLYLKSTVPQYSPNQHPQYGKIRDMQLDKGDFVFEIDAAGQRAAAEAERRRQEQAAAAAKQTAAAAELARQRVLLAEQKQLAEQQNQLAMMEAEIERLKLERERAALEQQKALLQEKQKLEQQRLELAKLKTATTETDAPAVIGKDKPWQGKWRVGMNGVSGTRVWILVQEGDRVLRGKGNMALGDFKCRIEGNRLKGSMTWGDGQSSLISATISPDGNSFTGSTAWKSRTVRLKADRIE